MLKEKAILKWSSWTLPGTGEDVRTTENLMCVVGV